MGRNLVLTLTLFCSVCHISGGTRPHIILMVADDLGWNDVGFHGSEIKTPYIDNLAYEGVILNNYYVSPICTPTRGALMTGRHPIHLGLQHGVIGAAYPWGLPLDHTTMAQYLKGLGYSTHAVGKHFVISAPEPWGLPLNHTTMGQHFKRLGYATHIIGKHYVISAPEPWGLPLNHTTMGQHFKRLGYATHIVGKWHLGYFKTDYLPTNRGFDTHFGYWNGKEDYFNHLDIEVYKGLDFRRNMEVVNKTGYSSEMYSEEARKIIEAHNASEPLFLYMAYQAVHAGNGYDPIQAPQEYIDRFPYITNEKRRKFAGVTAALDDSVGSVVRALRNRGMMDNAIIVFTTDNGGPANNYDRNAACNVPLRGTKNTMWEGGVHGVGFVHSNLLQRHRYISNNLIHVSDWLPTLYSAAGGNVSDLGVIDGIDQWKMLTSNGTQIRNELLHNIDPDSHFSAIRVGDYKLVQGDISGGRNDMWYPCNPPKFDSSNTSDANALYYAVENSGDVEVKKQISKRDSPHTPVNINCGTPPVNYTKNCEPRVAPCLFHISTDPCEYNNIAEHYPAIVQNLLRRIDEYASTAVKPVNKPLDKRADPKLHGGVWSPWE